MKQLAKSITPKWYPFMSRLLKEGKYQWKTPDKKGEEPLIVSTIYIDGDLHCDILASPDDLPEKLTQQTADLHIGKMSADMASLQKFATKFAAFLGVIILSGVWMINYEYYLESLIITAVFVPAALFLKKKAVGLAISFIFSFLKVKFRIQSGF
jgi:hypothetical protein